MSESNDAPAASADKAAEPAKGGGNKLIIILALVNFLAVLGLGGYLVYSQRQAAAQPEKAGKEAKKDEKAEAEHEAAAGEGEHEAAEGEHEAQEGEHEAPAGEHGAKKGEGDEASKASPHDDAPSGKGPLLALEALVTNLADPDSDRYLKVGIQLRLSSEAAKPEVESSLVPIRNQLLLYLSSLTIADTTGADNKREIQKRVKRIANESMPSSRITQVYFTEFVIQ